MATRREVEKAVLYSQLDPPARLIVLALLAKVDYDTAVIPPEFTPSLSTIEAMTGLSRSAVAEWLKALEASGWVKRSKPSMKSRDDRTQYALFAGSPTVHRAERASRAKKASSPLSGPPVVRGADHKKSDSNQVGSALSGPPNPSSSPPRGPSVVRSADPGSALSGPAPNKSSPTENSPNNPTLFPPSAGETKPDQKNARRITAADVVGAYFESTIAAGHPKPGETLRGRVGRQAKRLLADQDQDPDLILAAAKAMGERGWHDLEVQMQRSSAERARASPSAPSASEADLEREWKGLRS